MAAGTKCNAMSVSQYIVPREKIPPCDAAFHQNSFTICPMVDLVLCSLQQ